MVKVIVSRNLPRPGLPHSHPVVIKSHPSQIPNAPFQRGNSGGESGARGYETQNSARAGTTRVHLRYGRERAPETDVGGRERNPENNAGGVENPRASCAGPSWRLEVRRARGREAALGHAGTAARAGGCGLCLLLPRAPRLHPPHAPAVPPRPRRPLPLTCPALAMAEAASGSGGTSLEGERGKRPPPEGEPAAPASGVLGRCAAAGSVRVAGAWGARGGLARRDIGVSCPRPGVQWRGRLLPTLRLRPCERGREGAAGVGGPRAETRTRPSENPGS